VCVCVCTKGEVLEVDCKVRGASIRCGLEVGDGEAVLGGGGNDSFVFMILLLICHLWLDEGLDEGRDFSLGTCDDCVPL
jgi:hypothetical protein